MQDQDGGVGLVRLCPWIKAVVADGGCKKRFADAAQALSGRVIEVVKRPELAKGLVLLPKRWRVQQSIGALTISRRLKIDCETLAHVSAATIPFASVGRLLASATMSWLFPNGL